MPASCSFKIAVICFSLKLQRFIIVRLIGVGLYQKAVTFQENSAISARCPDYRQLYLGTSWLGKDEGVCRNLALIDRTIAKKLGGHPAYRLLLPHEVEVAIVL